MIPRRWKGVMLFVIGLCFGILAVVPEPNSIPLLIMAVALMAVGKFWIGQYGFGEVDS